jgi:hypothetical protein
VGNDPRYNQGCFAPFPFPEMTATSRAEIGALAEGIDRLRKQGIAESAEVTMTGIYNVVAKLRSGATLSSAERDVSTLAACPLIRQHHDDLDCAVKRAYGWGDSVADEDMLISLVALHDERMIEEQRGDIRWLRPEYQSRNAATQLGAEELEEPNQTSAATSKGKPQLAVWPKEAIEQIAAIKRLVADRPVTSDEAARTFMGAKRDIIARHLETLTILGELRQSPDGRFAPTSRPYQ